MPRLIRDHLLARFAADPELNPSTLSRLTVVSGVDMGIGEKTIAAILKKPGRVPEAKTLEAIARALGEDHEDYYEWPIAAARRDAAATPEAGRRRAADAARKAARRQSENPPRPRPDHQKKRARGRAA